MSQDQAPAPSLSDVLTQTPTAGAILAAQRKQSGLSLDDVSAKLKLSLRQIEALETDRYETLPGNTFVRGFVRNYARLLQIDPQPLIHYLDTHLPVEAPQAALPRLQSEALPTLRPGGPGGRSVFVLSVLAGLALVLIAVGGFWYVQQLDQEPVLTLPAVNQPVVPELVEPTALPDQVLPGTPAVAAPTAGSAVEAPAQPALNMPGNPPPLTTVPTADGNTALTQAAPPVQPAVQMPGAAAAPVGDEVRIVARQESWVQITDATGRRLVNELIPAGQARIVGGKPPYQVRIGNGHQTELYYKGKPTDLTPYIKVDVANLELN